MAYSLRGDEVPQSARLLQLLNTGNGNEVNPEEAVNPSDNETTPRPIHAGLAAPVGINIPTSDIHAFRPWTDNDLESQGVMTFQPSQDFNGNLREAGASLGHGNNPPNTSVNSPVSPMDAQINNARRQLPAQGRTTTHSAYQDQISTPRVPNLEQPSPLHHRNNPHLNPNHLLQRSALSGYNTGAAMSPRHVPSAGQLFSGRTTGGQGSQSSNLRRMISTPILGAPQVSASAAGNGPMHLQNRPPPISHTVTGQGLGGGVVPAHAKTAQYLRRIKNMILHAVQINRYKNGLFVTSITPRSDLINDMNVFINSAQVTGLDNLRMVNIKACIERIYAAIRQGNEVRPAMGGELWAVDIEAPFMIPELMDVLNSTDRREHARWLATYGNP